MSVLTDVDPDILLVDEALSVGDERFFYHEWSVGTQNVVSPAPAASVSVGIP